jgi:amidophosphoribosyltransferase
MDLIARRVVDVREGSRAVEKLEDYANPESENYRQMVDAIKQRLNFTSLAYNRLDDMIDAIGLPAEKLCTYCWNGKG